MITQITVTEVTVRGVHSVGGSGSSSDGEGNKSSRGGGWAHTEASVINSLARDISSSPGNKKNQLKTVEFQMNQGAIVNRIISGPIVFICSFFT